MIRPMFHVEQWDSMKYFFVIAALLTILGCKKPDPNPELKDLIYNDLASSLEVTAKTLESEKKTLEGYIKELAEVPPQTGQNKAAQKHVEDSRAKINYFEQEKAYLELKIESRKKAARKSYLVAYEKQLPWPDQGEWRSYEMEKKFRTAKKTWDVKSRIKELRLGEGDAPKKGGSGGH